MDVVQGKIMDVGEVFGFRKKLRCGHCHAGENTSAKNNFGFSAGNKSQVDFVDFVDFTRISRGF